MYSKTTSNIRISVVPEYDAKNSYPATERFVFRYNILIENLGSDAVKLIERKWLIYDVGFDLTVVSGRGVIGFLPEIEHNGNFTYFSNVILRSGIGNMRGSYIFKNLSNGTTFEVDIPKFGLLTKVLAN